MFFPRLVARGEVGHVPRAADGERAVAGERPGEVAAACLRAARAGGDNGLVVAEAVPRLCRSIGADARSGHAHRDGVVHARKRPLAAEDGRCRRQHGQLLQPHAILEEIVPRFLQPGGQREGGEAGAANEELVPRARQSVGEVNGGQPPAIVEKAVPHTTQPFGQGEGGQPGATAEEIVPHARQLFGQRDGGQPRAIVEKAAPHARQSVGEVNGGQPRAIAEEIVPHPRQSVGEVNGGQPRAIAEEIVPHARHALLHHGGADVRQVVFPRLVARGEVGHVPRAADGERAVAGEDPDEVAAACLRAARALGHGRLPPCLHGGQAEGCQK